MTIRVRRIITVKESDFQSHHDIAADCPLDILFGNQTGGKRLSDVVLVTVKKLPCGGFDNRSGTLAAGRETLVGVDEQAERAAVGTDDAVIAPLLAGNRVETGMYQHRDTVPAVVSGHESSRTALRYTFVEGIGIIFSEQAAAEVRRSAVSAELVAVREKMLHQSGRFPVARIVTLQSLDFCHRQFGDKKGVLAEGLLRASPARVTRKVGVRSPYDESFPVDARMLGIIARLLGNLRGNPADEVTVPGLPQPVSLREDGRR